MSVTVQTIPVCHEVSETLLKIVYLHVFLILTRKL